MFLLILVSKLFQLQTVCFLVSHEKPWEKQRITYLVNLSPHLWPYRAEKVKKKGLRFDLRRETYHPIKCNHWHVHSATSFTAVVASSSNHAFYWIFEVLIFATRAFSDVPITPLLWQLFSFKGKAKLIESFSYLLFSHLHLGVDELGLCTSCYVSHFSAFMKLLMPLIYLPFSARFGFLFFFFLNWWCLFSLF